MSADHVDVLIVGAGLSGIGAARHLQLHCPSKSFALLEARDRTGGTWDLFRYPGIRSDSDMHTLGYSFKPWTAAKSIADGPSILSYVRETAAEAGIDEHIRFNLKVVSAQWSTEDATWTVQARHSQTGEISETTCSFLFFCGGYYDYDNPYTPEFAGIERFGGRVVHPQLWPQDLDYAGKRVVVIGSGATAVTLVPAMAEDAAHVTMLQRSPTYIVSMPGEDPLSKLLQKVLPAKLVYPVVRWKNVLLTMASFEISRRRPGIIKAILRKGLERGLPAGYDIDKHFKPSYNPWEQRLCLVPDGDLFEAISAGTAEVVTDQIDTFTETGIRLQSGTELPADVIITATGLNLIAIGNIELTVDGEAVRLPERVSYKGMMLSGVPNIAMAFGYTNASWTLKADLTCQYVCRLLNHMDERGYRQCQPRAHDPGMELLPALDFSSGYVQRAIDKFPKQGATAPWRWYQNYAVDIVKIKRAPLEDGVMEFSNPRTLARGRDRVAA